MTTPREALGFIKYFMFTCLSLLFSFSNTCVSLPSQSHVVSMPGVILAGLLDTLLHSDCLNKLCLEGERIFQSDLLFYVFFLLLNCKVSNGRDVFCCSTFLLEFYQCLVKLPTYVGWVTHVLDNDDNSLQDSDKLKLAHIIFWGPSVKYLGIWGSSS